MYEMPPGVSRRTIVSAPAFPTQYLRASTTTIARFGRRQPFDLPIVIAMAAVIGLNHPASRNDPLDPDVEVVRTQGAGWIFRRHGPGEP